MSLQQSQRQVVLLGAVGCAHAEPSAFLALTLAQLVGVAVFVETHATCSPVVLVCALLALLVIVVCKRHRTFIEAACIMRLLNSSNTAASLLCLPCLHRGAECTTIALSANMHDYLYS